MNKIKITVIVLILFLSNFSSNAARLKYSDVYKVVLSGDKDKAYTLLLAYQKQDPDFANTYFQLGLIAKDWAKSFNPYKDFTYTKLFIYNTKLYFNLAKLYMKDEKGRNRSYYKNAPIIPKGRKLKIEDIEEFIDAQTEEIKDYEKNVVKIINNYNKSVEFYNECVSLFMKINSDYTKIKNIYLSNDEILTGDLQELETKFDSAIFYFNAYKKALNEYPLGIYNQTYKLRDIITYRLDGLTYSNFLQNNILLWNYKKWVQDVYKVKSGEIKENNNEIFKLNNLCKEKTSTLLNGNYSDDYKKFKIDNKFVYKIEKFDYNSLLIKLFKLNEAKINFLVKFKQEINNPAEINNFPLLKRAEYCYELLREKEKADSINKEYYKAVNSEQVKKYIDFYMKAYGGLKGLKEYYFRQEMFFDAKMNDALINLKKQLYASFVSIGKDSLNYGDKKISPEIHIPDNTNNNPDTYYITNFDITKKNTLWFSGYYIDKNLGIHGFTGFSKDRKKVDFIKKDDVQNMNSFNIVTSGFPDGCYTINTCFDGELKNILLKYDNKGKLVSKTELPYKKVPRLIKYDDINNNIVIVFNGNDIPEYSSDTEQIIYHFNPEDQLQTYEIKMNGKLNVFDLVKVNKKLLLFSNFMNYTDLNGNTISCKSNRINGTNILVSEISNGQIKKQIPYFKEKPFFGVRALKINSNTINILGYKSKIAAGNYKSLSFKELFYQLINPDGKIIFPAWHD